MVGRSSLTPEQLKTAARSSNLCLIMTANGTVETNEEATVYIKDLDMCVCVKSVDDSPAVCHAKRWAILIYEKRDSNHT